MAPLRFVGSLLILLVSVAQVVPASAQPEEGPSAVPPDTTGAAQLAAERWLQQVDTSAWREAWEAASALLTDSLSEEAWREQGRAARDTLGRLRSRRLERAQLRDEIEGISAEGPFAVLRFRSEFQDGLYAETVLAAWSGEEWRVAGYEVAPLVTSPPGRRAAPGNGGTE